ncbi:hypothetical protein C8J56DRAFT_884271 [Mycena floridula]|nr:hypothetical protein C8J56DRAFT_884271 [Mycena floridula]
MSTSESTIKHSGCKSLLKSYRPEMKLDKMSIDLSWLGNSRIPKFVPFEWQLKAAKYCIQADPWLRDLTPLPNTGCTATEDVNGLRTIAALYFSNKRAAVKLLVNILYSVTGQGKYGVFQSLGKYGVLRATCNGIQGISAYIKPGHVPTNVSSGIQDELAMEIWRCYHNTAAFEQSQQLWYKCG